MGLGEGRAYHMSSSLCNRPSPSPALCTSLSLLPSFVHVGRYDGKVWKFKDTKDITSAEFEDKINTGQGSRDNDLS